ncbi:dihydroxyacetone kinase phosphoryl donor subunit DhaM [Mycetocola zhadangensis]|uniref:Phosphocarrier protein HPr n=1 Tax=Mycetocola zhadangensis TaxID=1164595 RepID=A0A3L7J6B3_9MICO|nr:dihydroxyacetone kinase phosphoryl donor subunit DhaM [Mycetocola zhadangensis]RLQ86258.1 HPr family phosphocarrier protein [Mycetocola zhadangensis]GGE89668.1 PTS sugar transporter subunit IIA [Mycetocola zhadangensis]
MTVGIVLVSHSALIAEGLVQLARQMAPNVALVAAGGTDDGGIGTSFDRVTAAIADADSGGGVAILCDLGSAILTAETALDFLDDAAQASVRIIDAPLVEGGVAAAVAAQTGSDLDGVEAAARSAVDIFVAPRTGTDQAGAATPGSQASAPAAPFTGYSRSVTILNRDGLHARPAADFVKLASTFAPRVTVNGRDAKSLLAIMALGLVRGKIAEIATEDPAGREAVDALADLVESGFGEA